MPRLLLTTNFRRIWINTQKIISSPTLELITILLPLTATTRMPVESLLKSNLSQLATHPPSQDALVLRLPLTINSKRIWTNIQRTTLSPTSVLIMILLLPKATTEKPVENSPKDNQFQLSTQQMELRLTLIAHGNKEVTLLMMFIISQHQLL